MARIRKPTVSLGQVYGRKGASRLKGRLKRQASRQARREFQPQLRAARGQVKGARRAFRQEKKSLYGASEILQNSIAEQMQNLGSTGLKGKYKQQVAQELSAMQADAARYPSTMIPTARAAFQEEKLAARQDLAQIQADKATNAAQTYESLYGEALTDAQAAAKEAASRRSDRRENQGAKSKEVRAAVRIGTNMLRTAPKDVPWGEKAIKKLGSEDNAWRAFELALLKQEGIDGNTAQAAALAIRRRLGMAGWSTAQDYRAFRPGAASQFGG